MQEHPITGAFGAELTGLDLTGPISDDLAAALRDALARNLVLMIREQNLDIDAQRRLTRVFGEPEVNEYVPGPPEHPDMSHIVKEPREGGGVFGGGWHTDMSFMDQPSGGSVLCGLDIPPYGGDTMFLSQQAAWDSLPDVMKTLLEGRDLIHVGKPYGVKWAPPIEEQSMRGSTKRGDPAADRERYHPAVLTHPVTGRKGLYLNPTYTLRIDGMSEEASQPILHQLFAHTALPEHTLRLRWSAGAVAIWDNFSTQHYAINDYAGFRREMRRSTFQARPIADWDARVA